MKRQRGQVILLLILVMTVALTIGLSVVQKSLVDISTASKVEQSSRAFSAAEAGIEKALKDDKSLQSFTDSSSQITEINDGGLTPCIPGLPACSQVTDSRLIPYCLPNQPSCPQTTGQRQLALEFPRLAKEDTAQVWLADYKSPSTSPPTPPANFYTQNALDVYWGNSSTDKAALELTVVYYDGTKYASRKWYLDHSPARNSGFEAVLCVGNYPLAGYQCYVKIGDSTSDPFYSKPGYGPLPARLMLIRARLLYNTTSQPLAVQAVGTCGQSCSLPPQSRSITSTGASGETQRRVNLFLQDNVVPALFDYAIFSAGSINK